MSKRVYEVHPRRDGREPRIPQESAYHFGLPAFAQSTVTWNGVDMDWTEPDSDSWSGSTYTSGDHARFTGSGTGAVNVQVGGVTPATTTVTSGAYTFTGGPIAGTLANSGTLTLNSANTFSAVTASGGTLNLGHDAAAGSAVIAFTAATTLNLTTTGSGNYGNNLTTNGTGTITISARNNLGTNTHTLGTLSIGGNATFDVNGATWDGLSTWVLGPISETGGSRSLTKISSERPQASTLILSGAGTFTGDTRVTGGTLKLNHDLAIQNSAFDTSGGGTFDLTSVNTPTFGGLKGGTNLVLPGAMTSLTLNPGLAASHEYTGSLSGGSASLQLTKTGAGTQILSGANSYGGATNLNAGVLQANHASALGSGGNIVLTGGTLQYSAASAGQDWSARFKNSASSISLDTNGQTIALGAIDATNTGGLTKLGNGTLVLAGANSYTGATSIQGGTVVLSGSLASGSAVSVGNATLTGTGAAGGTITVNAGGTLAPGASIERLGSGALALNDGSTFAYELNSSVLDGDLLYVTGTVDLTGVVTLTLTELVGGKLAVGDKLTLIASTAPWSGDLFTYQGSLLALAGLATLRRRGRRGVR